MTLKQISMAIYSLYLTNKFGFMIKKEKDLKKKLDLRTLYAITLMKKLNITVEVINKEKLPEDEKYLLLSNHKSILDPIVVEMALKDTKIRGFWIAKKELYNSFFFGTFTRNAGTILLDREAPSMIPFFKKTKEVVNSGLSIFIFPEGTRNKTDSSLSEFKEGARVIALKNRLPMLPVYIRTNVNEVLKEAIENRTKNLTIEIEIGDIIEYKDKTPLEENYRRIFNLK
ncbi:MAG: 1-acyl-sn-glycerol-3-phosphate acyltransferase [Campylobacteraceae bacterium]|nr:1-acyl-sn-glycerol-3-phosphate acyltransferase [Campylobacteraceae bacterium]